MLLQEKMKNLKFSPSERVVIDFILDKQELIQDYSTIEIAKETYTSPSILVRISKKLGFNGYNDMKREFVKEVIYLKTNFQVLDANTPFFQHDSIMSVASKILQLKQESLKDTFSLINYDSLQKAINIIKKSESVKVFAVSNLTFQAEEFVHKLRHIGKKAETYSISNTMYQEAVMTSCYDCAVCISYSGESGDLLDVVEYLKRNNVSIISITSIGENTLSKLSDVTLHITTREKSYSKISGFSSLESIALILDILYSCYFKTDYDKHYEYKIKLSKITELRKINNHIICEE